MILVGMLDSPYVRRVAISLDALGLPFQHRAVSVFSTFEQFQALNPVVKAPSLIFEDGDVLMDSTLILDLAESLAAPGTSLMPRDATERRQALCLIGLGLAACEKAVQTVYERQLRPADKQHQPWLDRVRGQLLAACTALEDNLHRTPLTPGTSQAAITIAVAWQFMGAMLSDVMASRPFPALDDLSARSEALSLFRAYPPDGPGVPVPDPTNR